jgi:hypothetical protein
MERTSTSSSRRFNFTFLSLSSSAKYVMIDYRGEDKRKITFLAAAQHAQSRNAFGVIFFVVLIILIILIIQQFSL